MYRYSIILWDVDDTLLNFGASERAAITRGFEEFGLGECTEAMLADYSKINKKYWQMLERKEATKPKILMGRFYEFFEKYGIDKAVTHDFQPWYQLALGDTIVFEEGALETLQYLKGKVLQYAVTNGTKAAQTKKLRKSELENLFDDIFISEDLGAEKPGEEFFHRAFLRAGIDLSKKSEILIVGDSLSSDMKGGNGIGIDTCWYNPGKQSPDPGVSVTYEIHKINQVLDILRG